MSASAVCTLASQAMAERYPRAECSPDYHLQLTATRMHLSRSAKVNHLRPAADPLFASAARSSLERVLGVVLSGKEGVGAAGLAMIKQHRGTALVQHPDTAESPSMPLAAMMMDHPDEFLLMVENRGARAVVLLGRMSVVPGIRERR